MDSMGKNFDGAEMRIAYSVSVKYLLNEDKPKNNYYILSSAGDIHQFNPK